MSAKQIVHGADGAQVSGQVDVSRVRYRVGLATKVLALAALLLALLLAIFSPAQAQIPTGNGKWFISVGYIGNDDYSLQVGVSQSPAGPISLPKDAYVVSSSSDGSSSPTLRNHVGSGSMLGHEVSSDGRGVISMTTEAQVFYNSLDVAANAANTTANAFSHFDGNLLLSFTWLPAGGSVAADPPPRYLHIRYKRDLFIDFATAHTWAGAELVQPNGDIFSHATVDPALISLGGQTALSLNAGSHNAHYPPGELSQVLNLHAGDDEYVEAVLEVSTLGGVGHAVTTFPLSWHINVLAFGNGVGTLPMSMMASLHGLTSLVKGAGGTQALTTSAEGLLDASQSLAGPIRLPSYGTLQVVGRSPVFPTSPLASPFRAKPTDKKRIQGGATIHAGDPPPPAAATLYPVAYAEAMAKIRMLMDISVDGADLPHGMLDDLSQALDPTYTRWLPLAYTPTVNSQPIRYSAGSLPGPWGNTSCFYSIRFVKEPIQNSKPTPNFDVTGAALYYPHPELGASARHNSLGFGNTYAIVDASNERISFDTTMVMPPGVYSTFTWVGNHYELRNAGPPGAISSRGHYTYVFEPGVPTGSIPLRLVAIQDDLGNVQTLTWSGPTTLTVSDSSSGRQLIFSATNNAIYIDTITAPASPGVPAVRTLLGFDGNGHLGILQVYEGTSTTSTSSRNWTYGGSTGDAIVTETTNGITLTNTFNPSPVLDPFGIAIPRLRSTTVGSSTDYSSSDNGLVSVQATVTQTYGSELLGYGFWGVNSRIKTVTDARGNSWSQLIGYNADPLDNTTEGRITSMRTTGPDFSGAPASSNTDKIVFTPNSVTPTSATYTDQLGQNWTASFGANGLPTQALDPLGNGIWMTWGGITGTDLLTLQTDINQNPWQFGYLSGGLLYSITDPAGLPRISLGYNSYGQRTIATIPANASASGLSEITTATYQSLSSKLCFCLSGFSLRNLPSSYPTGI